MVRLLLFVILIFLSSSACNINKEINDRVEKDNKSIEIIEDHFFKDGISVHGYTTAQSEAIGYLYPFGDNKKTPHWLLAQWGSFNTLSSPSFTTQNDTIIYQNKAKRIYFIPQKDKPIRLGLEVYASREYNNPRQPDEDWVHLLFAQNYTNPLLLKDIQNLNYKINAKLLFCNNKMDKDYDLNHHTAQITLYITIQNQNKESSNVGDFFWFGLPLYDYRYKNIEEYGAEDLGKEDASKKFILTVASAELFQTSMHFLDWITIDKDIYSLLENAFKSAQDKGYMKNCSWNDLCISSMNIGWEVPGTFDCGILFDTPSLTTVLK